MTALAIIQAREGSTRFPRKVLAHFAGHSVIDHVYRRVRAAVFHTVVACPATDKALVRECKELQIPAFAWDGAETDVLGRFRACVASRPHVDVIVRITADCPFVQIAHIQACTALGRAHGYARLSFREGWPDGLDVEAFTPARLSRFASREHVTDGRPNAVVQSQRPLHHHRWTLDTRADLAWFKRISEIVPCAPPFHPTVEELLAAIDHDKAYGHFADPR